MPDEPECLCGQEPYTDGAMCPACFRVYCEELKGRFERGELNAIEAFAMAFVAAPSDPVDQEEEDDA